MTLSPLLYSPRPSTPHLFFTPKPNSLSRPPFSAAISFRTTGLPLLTHSNIASTACIRHSLTFPSLRFNPRLYPIRISCLARTFHLRPLTQPIQPPASHAAANTQSTQHTLLYVCLPPFSAPNTSRTPKNAYFHIVVSAPLSPPSTTITLTSKSLGIFGADLTNRWGSLPD